MWFNLMAFALSLIFLGGMYFRRRVSHGLQEIFSNSFFSKKLVRPNILYLLFGYPVLILYRILLALATGQESWSLHVGGILYYVLVLPFWISVLIVLQSLPFFLCIDLVAWLRKKLSGNPVSSKLRSLAFLFIATFFLLYTPIKILAGHQDIQLKTFTVEQKNATTELRILFFGDMQQDSFTNQERTQEVTSLIMKQNADLILVGGDWINRGNQYIQEATKTATQLSAPLGVFSVIGDHEHFAYRDRERSVQEVSAAINQTSVEMVDNGIRWVHHQGKHIAIILLNHNYMHRSTNAEVQSLLSQTETADTVIFVSHQFNGQLANVVKDKVDLVLAAHTHGGQVNPVIGFWHVPIARVETEYVEGKYKLSERTTVIVTAGIGFSIAPFRYGSPASMEIIKLQL